MAIEIVDFPINSMVIFHSKMLVHQRVPIPEHPAGCLVPPAETEGSNLGPSDNEI